MKTRDSQSSDVIIIGGGATGAGIARDCVEIKASSGYFFT